MAVVLLNGSAAAFFCHSDLGITPDVQIIDKSYSSHY